MCYYYYYYYYHHHYHHHHNQHLRRRHRRRSFCSDRVSLVCVPDRLMAVTDKSLFDSAQAHKIYLVSKLPRPVLDLTWSPLQ